MLSNKKKIILFLLLIIFISFFLRFWQQAEWQYFMIDEERDAFMAKRIAVDHRPVLLGGAVPGGIYLGPAFYYLTSIIMFVAGPSPIGGGVVASFLGAASVIVLFLVARKLFSQKTAYLATVFYLFSYLVIIYNRIWWPLTPTPLIALGLYYCLYQIIKHKKTKFIYLLSLIMVLGVQTDPSNLAFLVLLPFLWYKFKLPFKNKIVFRSIGLFFIAHLPLAIFDLRHNFLNSRALLKLLSFSSTGEGGINPVAALSGVFMSVKTFARVLFISGPNDLVKQISPCDYYLAQKDQIPLFLLIFTGLVLALFLIKTVVKGKTELGQYLVGIHFFTILLGIFLYNLVFPGYTYEWFFYTFFPGFCIITADFFIPFFKKRYLKFIVYLFLSIFVFLNINTFFSAKNSFGLKDKISAVKYAITATNDKPFFLDSLGSCFGYGGYRYLFYAYGKEPVSSYMDYVYFDWLYPSNNEPKPDLGVVLVSPSDKENEEFYQQYNYYKSLIKESNNFGNIEVLIVGEN